jgi:hypothetical protein
MLVELLLRFLNLGLSLPHLNSWSDPLLNLLNRSPEITASNWNGIQPRILLIEVDAFRFDDLMPQVERILPAIEACGGGEPLFADDEAV